MISSPETNEGPHRRSQPAKPALLMSLATVVVVALLATACSSSSSGGVAQVDSGESTTTTGSDSRRGSGSADIAAFNACMRRHGVPLSARGTPRYGAAKTTCARFLPRDDDAPDPRLQAQQLRLVLRYAACMRRNGLPSFPDPKPDPGGYVKISPDELTALGLNPSSPKYRAAEQACKDEEPRGVRRS
jgi:hypothetical protein